MSALFCACGPGISGKPDSSGQLGTVSSSRQVKEDISEMGAASERLLALRNLDPLAEIEVPQ